jgi:uncharacterized MAPEG superfamily protein
MSHFGLNLSILSIPAFYVLAYVPHVYAASLAGGGNPSRMDQRSPHSTLHKENLKAYLDVESYARYERAEAASANAYENIPLFTAAVLAGNFANLPKTKMDRFALAFLAIRAAHSVAYINTTTQRWTWVRSVLWATTLALSFGVLYDSAVKLA